MQESLFEFGAQAGASMFGNLTPPKFGPDADAMEAELKRVMARRHVKLLAHHTRIFDLHVPSQARAYEKLMTTLVAGMQALTHQIWTNERALVPGPKGSRWMKYLEWSEFELQVTPTMPVGTAAQS